MRETWNDWVERAVVTRVDIAKLIPRAGWDLVIPLVFMNLVSGLIPVAFVVATSILIGRVPAAVEGGVDSAAWDSLVDAFIFAAIAFLLAQVIAPIVTAMNSRVRRRVDGHLREEIVELVNRTTSIAPMEDQDVLDELSETARQFDFDWNTPGMAVSGQLALLARYGALVAFCALLSLETMWWTGVVMFAAVMMFRYANRGGLRRFSAVWRTIMPTARRRDYLRELAMSDVAAKETRVFGINGWIDSRYGDAYWSMYGPVARARRKIYFYPYIYVTTIGFAVTAFLLFRIGEQAVAGAITLTGLALGLQAVMGAVALGHAYEEADTPTQFGMRVVEALRNLRKHIAAAEDREREQTAANAALHELGEVPATGAKITALPSKSLEFRGIEFTYPGASERVLKGLDIEIPAGRSTAIVGVNGAGKTTLVKLLTRLYEPSGGSIIADGVNVGQIDPIEWRKQVSVIFQDFVRFEFTAADNIAVGANHKKRSMKAIKEAARRADILEAFDDHKLGLNTPLARAYEDGIDLSGGQWQRIAIARSLYALHHGAKVLVLDEPTSALDVRAEVAFFERFRELTKGVTSLLISHRFSSVRRADHIVVIDDGKVSEQGSHAELMKSGGHYERLFTLQAERFAKGLSAEGDEVDEEDPDAIVDLMEGADA